MEELKKLNEDRIALKDRKYVLEIECTFFNRQSRFSELAEVKKELKKNKKRMFKLIEGL